MKKLAIMAMLLCATFVGDAMAQEAAIANAETKVLVEGPATGKEAYWRCGRAVKFYHYVGSSSSKAYLNGIGWCSSTDDRTESALEAAAANSRIACIWMTSSTTYSAVMVYNY